MFIEFTFNPKLFFILIYPLFKITGQFLTKLYIQKDNNLFRIFRTFLSKEFSFIFLLILKCMNKKDIIKEDHEKNEESNTVKITDEEIKKISRKNKIKSILFLFLLSALNVGSYFFNYYLRKSSITFCRNSIGLFIRIIIFYVLSLFILKEKYYKHHYISMSIICVTLIALFIIYLIKLHGSDNSIYNAFWYYLVYYSLYGLFDILLKKYFLVYFYSIYFVILMIGAFACVPMLIYDIITYFVNKDISGIIIGLINNAYSVKNAFLFIVDLLFLFASNLGIFWTIYYFSPFHLIIIEFIYELINYYIRLSQYKNATNPEININFTFLFEKLNIIIFSVVFFINFICSLIFNEIIILKFCKLEYYTKKYIKNRAGIDINSLFKEEVTNSTESELVNFHNNE